MNSSFLNKHEYIFGLTKLKAALNGGLVQRTFGTYSFLIKLWSSNIQFFNNLSNFQMEKFS